MCGIVIGEIFSAYKANFIFYSFNSIRPALFFSFHPEIKILQLILHRN